MKNAPIVSTTHHSTLCSEISVVMPSIPQDIDTLIRNTEFFFRFLPIKNIYVVGPESIAERVRSENNSRLIFMNENEFVDVQRIKELYSSRTDKNTGRAGWYVQQYIKMQFARFTNDEYYFIWDSDTIPLKPVELFDEASGKPIIRCGFVMRSLYAGYLDTFCKILPSINNTVLDTSFIREHMLIKTQYMREILDEIESNPEYAGNNFQEKILNAAEEKYIYWGFSEFQTYGIFITARYPNSYIFSEKWRSLRTGQRFVSNTDSLSEEQIKWFASKYNVMSIEKWQRPTWLSRLVDSKLFRSLFPPTMLEILAQPARIIVPTKYRPYVKRFLHL